MESPTKKRSAPEEQDILDTVKAVLLDIEGTTTPLTFIKVIFFLNKITEIDRVAATTCDSPLYCSILPCRLMLIIYSSYGKPTSYKANGNYMYVVVSNMISNRTSKVSLKKYVLILVNGMGLCVENFAAIGIARCKFD